MDAIAGLAFGIVVVNVIRGLGVEDGDAVASNTVRAGIFSCLLMAVIYFFVTLIGVHSRGVMASAENGGVALAQIAKPIYEYYFNSSQTAAAPQSENTLLG